MASMLYRDYSREEGEWIPNVHGGRENLEAIDFLRTLNTEVYQRHSDVQMFAEESTDWPMVSKPIYLGGLGFGLKWDMGWMHDTLKYMAHEPVHRKYHHNELTFRMIYAFHENFIAAAVARRGGARQGIVAVARCRATTGRSSPICGCCTVTCTACPARSCCSWGRVWPVGRMAARCQPAVESA